MTTPTVKECIACDVELVAGENWYPSFVLKKHYKCKMCYDERRLINKINLEGPKRKYVAQLLKLNNETKYAAAKEGHVYIITNPAWPNWFKVGSSLDAVNRRNSYQTSSPKRDYKLEYKKYFNKRRSAESRIHIALSGLERSGEWFKTNDINNIKEVINATT